MKKFILVSVAVLLFSVAGFAKGGDVSVANYDFNIRVSELSKYLQLTSAQTQEVASICDYFTDQMRAVSYSSEKNKKVKLNNAVYGNLKLMKKALTEEQYKKYLQLLNVTLNNKGIAL